MNTMRKPAIRRFVAGGVAALGPACAALAAYWAVLLFWGRNHGAVDMHGRGGGDERAAIGLVIYGCLLVAVGYGARRIEPDRWWPLVACSLAALPCALALAMAVAW